MPFSIFKIRIRRRRRRPRSKRKSNPSFLLHKSPARDLVASRLIHFNSFYNFTYNRISIRNQSSRWGSCSKKGNLNFNFRIALLPPELADYLIVHELCHLGEFNHSKKFWDLVGKTLPDWRILRKRLKEVKMVT